jgi:hypothetical protein
MAAAHVGELAALGLKSLKPQQVRLAGLASCRGGVLFMAGCCVPSVAPAAPGIRRLRNRAELRPFPPVQITESHATAGAASQLVYARIDAPRFSKIYSAKGRWGLLDSMLLTPAAAAADAGSTRAARAVSTTAPAAATAGASAGSSKQTPAMDLQQVEQAVKGAAADILGEELGGEERSC